MSMMWRPVSTEPYRGGRVAAVAIIINGERVRLGPIVCGAPHSLAVPGGRAVLV